MAIFLSVQNIETVVAHLKEGYQREDVPIAIVYKASWPDQKILQGTLTDIVEQVKASGIRKTAQILVGDFISADFDRSLLYDPSFTHAHRRASPDREYPQVIRES